MQVQTKLRSDLKRWAGSDFVKNLSRQFSDYEVRVREVVRDFDLKSRDAREKSKEQIEKLTRQIKVTRGKVENRVSGILNVEGQRLNVRVRNIFNYLKSIARDEKLGGNGPVAKKASTKTRASHGKRKSKKPASKRKGRTLLH